MRKNIQDSRFLALKAIRDEVVGLSASPLLSYRNAHGYKPVIGEGDHYASIMFVGEAPGENEAKTGKPFCGAAGKFLTELIESIGLSRKDVYITNILKDRPPGNRDPLPEEVVIYGPFLEQQIKIVQPKVIVTLGRFSAQYIMNLAGLRDKIQPISVIHGKAFENGDLFNALIVIPQYHPAASLYNPSLKKTLMEDFKIIRKYI